MVRLLSRSKGETDVEAALVVGGAGSIGVKVVKHLLEARPDNFKVHVFDREYGRLGGLPTNLKARVEFHPGDASKPEDVECVFGCLGRKGDSVTTIVIAAGGMVPRERRQSIEKHLEGNMRANFWPVVYLIDQMIELFKSGSLPFQKPPNVIVLGTADAKVVFGDHRNCGYAVAKATLLRYLLAVAAGWRGPDDPNLILMTLGTVIPELVEEANPRWFDRLLASPWLRKLLGRRLNGRTVLTPEKVAQIVVWILACPCLKVFNGLVLDVTNGLLAFGHCASPDEPDPFANPDKSTDSDPKP